MISGRRSKIMIALDPARDGELRELDTEDLRPLISDLCKLLGADEQSFLQYAIRNLRRRVLYYLTPKRMLRMQAEPLSLRADIENELKVAFSGDELEEVSRELRRVIRRLYWNRRQYDYAETIIHLSRRTGPFCHICGYRFRKDDTDISDAKVIFSDEPYPVNEGFFDSLKPLSKKPKRRRPVVDHIVPLTSFGLCELKNYQLLCDQCNDGKTDYLSYTEPRFASGFRDRNRLTDLSIAECALFFAVLDRDKECVRCNRDSEEIEMTVFPIDNNKCVTFDTLKTVCYDCDNYNRRWLKHGARINE